MRLPILQFQITVGGAPVATFPTEPVAAKITGQIAELIAAAGGTAAGAVGFGPIKSVVDGELGDVQGTLDTAALVEAFGREEVAKAEAEAKAAVERERERDAAADEPLVPDAEALPIDLGVGK